MRPLLACVLLAVLVARLSHAADDAGVLRVTKQSRVPVAGDAARFEAKAVQEAWNPRETAVIVCDVWDSHHCQNAVKRVNEMVPRINLVLDHLRGRGVLVIHAPSDCMKFYADHPGRKLALAAPAAANPPKDIGVWCHKVPAEEKAAYPLDQSDGGEDDDPAGKPAWEAKLASEGRNPKLPWRQQHPGIAIQDGEAVTDRGAEVWNLLEARGVRNVILLGVHTNMCVLGRPFGLRRLSMAGKDVVLMRDLTDAMYNPARSPYVSHYRGTELIVEHIEGLVCPTITSDQLVGGEPFAFAGSKAPRVVVAIAEPEYKTRATLPLFAAAELVAKRGYDVRYALEDGKDANVITGLGPALLDCDLLVLSVRRKAIPKADLDALRAHLAAGKPLVAIRTSSHAWDAKGKKPVGHDEWPAFDKEILGGNYQGHHGAKTQTTVTLAAGAAGHAVLRGVDLAKPYVSPYSLYRSAPLAASATALLTGAIPGQPAEPVAWVNERTVGEGAAIRKQRIFYTSLVDFDEPRHVTLLGNAAQWALDK